MRQRYGLKHSRNKGRIRRNAPHCVIPTIAQAEWRNPLRGMMNQHKIKLATWEDSSTRFTRSERHIGALFHSTARVIFATPPERHIGRSLQFRRWVVPFNRTGYIRHAPGTAHRPFPTISLIGVFLNQRVSKRIRPSPITVNCKLSTVNSNKLSTVNCQLSIFSRSLRPH